MTFLTFRDSMTQRAPRWLRRGVAGAFVYVLGMMMDAMVELIELSVKSRFPGVVSNQSLEVLGRDRRIRRGIYETDESYAARLTRWIDDHEFRGGPYSMLTQLHLFFAPNNFPVELVYRSGRRFTLATDGTITRDDVPLWQPDEQPEKWARWWLFYHFAAPLTADGNWDSAGTWDDGGVWDSTLTVTDVANLRAVPNDWNAAHAFGRVVLLSPTSALWNYPPGVWDEPGDTWETDTPAEFEIT